METIKEEKKSELLSDELYSTQFIYGHDVNIYQKRDGREMRKKKSEGVVIGGEDHKNYIDMEEYMKLKRENEELKKEVERLQKVLYTITGSRDDGEPDLYEDC